MTDQRHRDPLNHFLLVFDHKQGKLVREVEEFGEDVETAMRAYEHTEREFEQNDDVEIVLIGSDSLETVQQTHANYFDGTAALARALAQILSGVGPADSRSG